MKNLHFKLFLLALFVFPITTHAVEKPTVEEVGDFLRATSTGTTTQSGTLSPRREGESYEDYLRRQADERLALDQGKNLLQQIDTWGAAQKAEQNKNQTNISNTVLNSIVPPNNTFGTQPLSRVANQLFYLGLIIAVVLAVVTIIRGGIQYMTTDSITGKEDGKKLIQAALGGLVLAFAGVLILNTINPNLTQFNLTFAPVTLEQGRGYGLDGSITSGTRGDSSTSNGYNNSITPTTEGFTAQPGRVAIDTDGSEKPPFNDPDWQGQTSYPGLNANKDNYVVVPIGSDIPLGTKVRLYNQDTQKEVWGIVGDRGPTANGLGEISLNAARELGAWTDGMGNAAKQHKITYTFYTKENK